MAERIPMSDLESYLWGSAVLLRTNIDAGSYKQYIFPLLFFKRLCDVYDEETAQFVEDYGEDASLFEEDHTFIIPEGHHWKDVRKATEDVGQAIVNAFRAIEKANGDKLTGIFGDGAWTNKNRLPDRLLKDLLEHFSKLTLSIANCPEDELGQGYEYLIKKFADDSGHTAQEFYTNRTVVHLMTEMLQPQSQESIIQEFGYDLSRTCDDIRPTYHHVETCQQTVPEAITAFLEGTDFEDVIRTAVSLGGDCDTLTCIACGIAEAFYDVPEEILLECKKRLPNDMLEVIARFMDCRKSSLRDPFLAGNELVEEAIEKFYEDSCKEHLVGVLEAIRQRMHADGHFMFPVVTSEDGNSFALRTVQSKDGKEWIAAFTSPAEHEKGEPSEIVSNFIDVMLKEALTGEHAGFIINPWGKSFMLAKELIEMIFKADGDVEYAVPDDPITAELLEDGSFLKRAIEICNRNRTQLNLVKLMKILRDSWIWIPCGAIMSDADNDTVFKMIEEAEENGGLDTLVGKTITSQDQIRLVPDILQNGDEFFFPVFSASEEMGEYGKDFSKIQRHFLEAINLARNNEKKVKGIVVNAFTEPFVIPIELLEIVTNMDSAIEPKE